MKKKTYFVVYPRNFVNEYTVYVVDNSADASKLTALQPNAIKINRTNAVYLGYFAAKKAQKERREWFGGFVNTTGKVPTNMNEAIEFALQSTLEYL